MSCFLHRAWLALLLAGLTLAAQAQAPSWQMATEITNSNSFYSAVQVLTADAAGNLYLAGNFQGTIALGSTTLTTAAYQPSVFVAKWNTATSSFEWAQQVGAPGIALALVQSGGSLYVASTGTLTKLTTAGSVVWSQAVPGLSALAVSNAALYVAGTFGTPITLGSFTLINSLPNTGTPPFGSNDLYVAKLTDTGTSAAFAWVQQATGQLARYGAPVQLAASGTSLYVTGELNDATTFGNSRVAPGSGVAGQAFAAKLLDAGASGSFSWAQAVGGAGQAQPLSLLARGADLYLAGSYSGAAATFGSTVLTNADGSPYPDGDAFVAKLTDAGTGLVPDWALRAGGTGRDSASTLLLVGNALYVGGRFSSPSASFGAASLPNSSPTTSPRSNLFVARIAETAAGAEFAWAVSATRQSVYRYDTALALAASGPNLYVAGYVGPATTFGSTTLTSPGSTSVGYLASLGANALATAPVATPGGLVLYPNPAHGMATVRVPAGAGTATLTLLDALGRVTGSYTAPAGQEYPLSLAGLAPGVYALRVQVGEALATQKLVVE